MTLEDKQADLVEEITLIPDAYERLGYIVERGKKAAKLQEELHIDLPLQIPVATINRNCFALLRLRVGLTIGSTLSFQCSILSVQC